MTRLNSHLSRRWYLDSTFEAHRQHSGETGSPQETNLDLVGSLSNVATHIVKAFLGVAPLNQTEIAQYLTVAFGLKHSQVFEAENPLHISSPIYHSYESSWFVTRGSEIVVRKTCSFVASSDLGDGRNHPVALQA